MLKRQIDIIEEGESVIYQTMTFNAKDKKTTATRSKEEAHDYRYFPEPDLVKVRVGKEWIDKIEKELPEFPEARRSRFIKEFAISESDADELTLDKFFADKFENTIDFLVNKNERSYKTIANIFRVDIKRVMNEKKLSLDEFHISDKVIADIGAGTGYFSVNGITNFFPD